MVPVIRSLVSFAAGVARMPIGRFTLFSFLGSLPFTAVLVFAGMQLGASWESIGPVIKRFEYAIVAVLVVIALAWIWLRIVKPRRAARADAPGTRG
jgi:membrane protein DedA with SNARE-associated domain